MCVWTCYSIDRLPNNVLMDSMHKFVGFGSDSKLLNYMGLEVNIGAWNEDFYRNFNF